MSLNNPKLYYINWPLWVFLMILSLILLGINGTSKEINTVIADSIKSKAVGFRNFFDYGISEYFSDFSNKSKVINNLREENTALKKQLSSTYKLELENKYLQNKLNSLNNSINFIDNIGLKNIVTTGIISNNLGSIGNSLTIGLGYADGIRDNKLVITNKGVVGYTYDVKRKSSKILSTLDADFKISAITEKTKVNIVISGNKTLTPNVTIYSQGIQIQEGEIAYTSGLEGNFPKFIAIGKIIKAPNNQNKENVWKIELFEDFNILNYVYIVK